MLFVVEDLHWIDPSSLDLLTQLIEHVTDLGNWWSSASARSSCLPGPRPGARAADLNRLDRGASVRVITETADMAVPTELLDQLVEKADGVPLYLEELTKLVVEQGLILATGGRRPGPTPGPRQSQQPLQTR